MDASLCVASLGSSAARLVQGLLGAVGSILAGCAVHAPVEVDRLPIFASNLTPPELLRQVADIPCVARLSWEDGYVADGRGVLFETRSSDKGPLVVSKSKIEYGPEESAAIVAQLRRNDIRQVSACMRIRTLSGDGCVMRNARRERYNAIVSLESVLRYVESPVWLQLPQAYAKPEDRVRWIELQFLYSEVMCSYQSE